MEDNKYQSLVNFFKLIPRIFCVSYISNRGRRDKIQSLWNNLGIDDRIEYMYGFPDKKSYKCSCKVINDHVSIFLKAYREKWPFVFVFEDDAVLNEGMLQIELEEIKKFLNKEKDGMNWTAVMLGYDPRYFFFYNSWKGSEKGNILFRMNGLFSHSYLISRSGIEKFLLSWRQPLHPIHIGAIDSFFLVDDRVYSFTHNIFGQEDVDAKQTFIPVKSYLFRLANWIWWNRLEGVILLLTIIYFIIKQKL